MKNLARILLVFVTISLSSVAASAQVSQFIGKFKNVNMATDGVTTLEITGGGAVLKVHAWGKCTPTDCDWGTEPGYAYSSSAAINPVTGARAVSAVFHESFKETILIIRPLAGKRLRVELYTRFTDSSGRFAYTDTYIFRKV